MPTRFLLLAATLLLSTSALAQSNEQLSFALDRPGTPPTRYTLTIDSKGKGSFQAPGAETTEVRVSPDNLRKLLAAIPVVEGGRCETHLKSIAQTGRKTLHYTGPTRSAECTYNYSDQDRLNDATATFEAIAETLRYGDKLRSGLRFDRLGLDSDLETLENAVAAHTALEVGNIAPVLHAIIDNDRVIDHARRRAEHLLALSGTEDPSSANAQAAASAPSSDR